MLRVEAGVAPEPELGTSRMLSERPVVGSLVKGWAGS